MVNADASRIEPIIRIAVGKEDEIYIGAKIDKIRAVFALISAERFMKRCKRKLGKAEELYRYIRPSC